MVNSETTLSPEDEQDPGFKAAQAWFLANEIGMEKREEALARVIAERLGIRLEVLLGRARDAQQRLEAVEQLAEAQGWSDEMRKIEFERAIELATEQLRQIPGVERAVRVAERKRDLPAKVMAALPEAVAEVRRNRPDARLKKGSVVHELQQLLASKHGGRVSKARIARAVPADFASRD
jgi:hypothetical protein